MKKSVLLKKMSVFLLFLGMFAVLPALSASSQSPEAVKYYNAGIEFVQKDDYQSASNSFQKALEYDPEFIDAYYNLGSIYEHFGDYETALFAYSQVVAIEPRDYEAKYKMASIYYQSQMYPEALECIGEIPSGTQFYSKAQELKKNINSKSNAVAAKKSSFTPTTTVQQERTMEGRTQSGGYTDTDKSLLSKYSSPTGIVADDYGNIFIASYAENKIYVVTEGEKNQVFSESTMINGPIGLAVDEAGNVYVANYNKNNILKISRNGNVNIFKDNVMRPYSLEIIGNVLYVSEQGTNSVIKFKL